MDKFQFVDAVLAIAGASKIDIIKRDQLERLFEKLVAEDIDKQIEERIAEATSDLEDEISDLEDTIDEAKSVLSSAMAQEDWDLVDEVYAGLHT